MNCVLSEKAIRELISQGVDIVSPFVAENLQPASIDLTLGNQTFQYKLTDYVLGQDIDEVVEHSSFETLTLEVGKTAFVGLNEKISIPNDMIGIVFPRSSITRLGVNIGTSFINPGYTGVMPITITNNSNMSITLAPGYKVVQMVVLRLSDVVESGYSNRSPSKYSDESVEHSRMQDDEDIQSKIDAIIKKTSPTLYAMMKK